MKFQPFSLLQTLYAYTIFGSYKPNFENDIQCSRISALLAMHNILPYPLSSVLETLKQVSNDMCAQSLTQDILFLMGDKSRYEVSDIPSASKVFDTIMNSVWNSIFTPLQFWPEYLRNPFGTGLPILTKRENEKIAKTGSHISSFYGKTDLSVWKSSWTFPLSQNLRFETQVEALGDNLMNRSWMVSISTEELLTSEVSDFIRDLSEYSQEIGLITWLPIQWPNILTFYNDMEPRDSLDIFPVPISDMSLYTRAFGIFPLMEGLSLGCYALLDEMKSLFDPIEDERGTIETESVDNIVMRERIAKHLGVNGAEGLERAVDEVDRFDLVNKALALTRGTVKAYTLNGNISRG